MSDKSNNLGRAFEYACIEVLEKRIAEHRTVKVDKTSVMAAYNAWQAVEQEQQDSFITAANAFIDTLFQAEPLILEYDSENDIIERSYNLEVCSAGLDRELIKDSDYVRFAGRAVEVKTYEQINGSKSHEGILSGKKDGIVMIDTGAGELAIPADKIAKINLAVVF